MRITVKCPYAPKSDISSNLNVQNMHAFYGRARNLVPKQPRQNLTKRCALLRGRIVQRSANRDKNGGCSFFLTAALRHL